MTWGSDADGGSHCNLKKRSGLASYSESKTAISAVLLTGVEDPIGVLGGGP